MKMSPNYVSIYLPPGFIDMRPFKWHEYVVDTHYTYTLDLKVHLNDIWGGFDATCRKNIKRSEKLKPVIKQVHDVDRFYSIMEKRYEKQGLNLPIFSPQYLADLLATFPNNIKMYFIYLGGEVIALCINCEYKSRIIHWLGAAKFDNGIAGNDYLLWESIKIAKAAGFTEFEIQGANQKRLSQFKSKFNPRLDVYYSIEKRDNIGKLAEWAYFKLARKKTLSF
jgi:lipid II:glycine glycyltransferase (peptidoglycan interpeptide bridge formation enzyme)